MTAGVEITGLDELISNFSNLSQEIETKIVRKAVMDATKVLVEALVAACPVNTEDVPSGSSLPPGAMKSDIHARMSRQPEPGTVAGLCEFGKFTYYVAGWVEYGHDQVEGGRHDGKTGRGSGTVTGHVRGHPFIRPAFESSADTAQAKFIQSVGQGVAKAIKKQGKS